VKHNRVGPDRITSNTITAKMTLNGWVQAGNHRTLTEKAFAALQEAIVTGRFAAGERLLIDELTELLEMSKMPIREALRQLEVVGLVETVPHRGARVMKLSVDDLYDVYRARLAVEPLAVRCAAERFGAEHAREAHECLARLHALPPASPETWQAHAAFHYVFYEAAESPWLMRLITPLWQTTERYRFAMPIQPRSASSRSEHKRILDACIANDAHGAGRECHDHLARTANIVAQAMGADAPFKLVEVPKRSAIQPPTASRTGD